MSVLAGGNQRDASQRPMPRRPAGPRADQQRVDEVGAAGQPIERARVLLAAAAAAAAIAAAAAAVVVASRVLGGEWQPQQGHGVLGLAARG